MLFDCHIINDSSFALTYTNELRARAMCNLCVASLGIAPISTKVTALWLVALLFLICSAELLGRAVPPRAAGLASITVCAM